MNRDTGVVFSILCGYLYCAIFPVKSGIPGCKVKKFFASGIRGEYVCLPSFKTLNSIFREVASKPNLLKRRENCPFSKEFLVKVCFV